MEPKSSESPKYSLRQLLLIAVVLLGIGLSYLKVFDDYSASYTDQAIKQAAITYASARAINALVSMLQTSTIEGDAIFISGSVSIGELLDPINDLIERFSTVMTVVLASLAVQKFLMFITGQDVFLHLLTASGFAVVLCVGLQRARLIRWSFRFFLVTLALRFSMVLVLGLNGFVDRGLIWNETLRYDQGARQLQAKLDPGHVPTDTSSSQDDNGLESYARQTKSWVASVNLDDLGKAVERSISDFMMLIAIYLVKTILIPLSFLYLVYLAIRIAWRGDIYQLTMQS